jgi:hypothetical protein
VGRYNQNITNGCTGQISAVTFCAKIRTKVAIKNLLGEPGVRFIKVMMNNLFFLVLFCLLPVEAFASGSMFSHSQIYTALTYMAFLSVVFGVIISLIYKHKNKATKFTLFQSISQVLGFTIISFFAMPFVALLGYFLVAITLNILG